MPCLHSTQKHTATPHHTTPHTSSPQRAAQPLTTDFPAIFETSRTQNSPGEACRTAAVVLTNAFACVINPRCQRWKAGVKLWMRCHRGP